MFILMITFALLSPLIGIYMMEQGALSWSTGVYGHPNGASIAYLNYLIVVIVTASYWIFLRLILRKAGYKPSTIHFEKVHKFNNFRFRVFAIRLLLLNVVFGIVFIFGFGSYKVVVGVLDKGSFRASLGPFGSVAYMFTKTIIPFLLACLVILYQNAEKVRRNKILVTLNVFIAFSVAMTWGFKTTGIAVLLPAGVIYLWNSNSALTIKYTSYAILTIIGGFYIFDASSNLNFVEVLNFLFTRATVLQGDVSWWVWDLYTNGDKFPPYGNTLLAALGGRILSLFGVDQSNLYVWMLHHYDWMLNYVAGVSLQRTADGHSIVGTPFSEGIIIGGLAGVWFIGAIAGTVIGLVFNSLRYAIRQGKILKSAVLATYFSFNVFPWLMGGGMVQLFHISFAVGFFIAIITAKILIPRVYSTQRIHISTLSSSQS